MKCAFAIKGCPDEAVARVYLSRGCYCLPDEAIQDLCAQHLDQCSPMGDMKVLKDYRLTD